MATDAPDAIPVADKAQEKQNPTTNNLYNDAYRDLIRPTSNQSVSSACAPGEGTSAQGNATASSEATFARGEDGFQITDSAIPLFDSPPSTEILRPLEPFIDPSARADQFGAALNGGLFDWGTDVDGALDALRGLTPEQIDEMEMIYKQINPYSPITDARLEGMSEHDLKLFESILQAENQVPVDQRMAGRDKLLSGSELKVGETNRVTFPDGRQYDVYIPENARKDMPVIMALHGAEFGNAADARTMEKETGLNQLAEQYGVAIVYPYAKPRESGINGSDLATMQGSGWNMANHVDLMTDDDSYDDGEYLDAVISDLNQRVDIDSTQISLTGFSDGARAAQQYVKDRPGEFESVISMSGTWMQNEAYPEEGTGVRTMIVHGGRDYMLDYDQGQKTVFGWSAVGVGPISELMMGYIPNFPQSRPMMQLEAAAHANGAQGAPQVTTIDGVRKTAYSPEQTRTGNEVVEYLDEGAQHAWHDWRNGEGWRAAGVSLGEPDTRQNFSEIAVQFALNEP